LAQSDKAVGIDVGLEEFATLSNNKEIPNPRFFKTDEKALASSQRKMSECVKGTFERTRAKRVVRSIHERIFNRRHNFIHQTARQIVNEFGVIAVEKLNTKGMLQNNYMAKSIADASWGMFLNILAVKAEEAGREFVKVNPNGTTQMCSRCHSIVPKDLSVRIHSCSICGLKIGRDLNSSFNILALGLQSLGLAPRSLRF
jgi:putative transposase